VRDAIYSSGNDALIAQFESLARLRGQISQLQQKEDNGTNKDYLQSLEAEADTLDKALTQASAEFRNLKADMALQWQDVQGKSASGRGGP
jgi:molecular chaperone GrpE (heat shock protein)